MWERSRPFLLSRSCIGFKVPVIYGIPHWPHQFCLQVWRLLHRFFFSLVSMLCITVHEQIHLLYSPVQLDQMSVLGSCWKLLNRPSVRETVFVVLCTCKKVAGIQSWCVGLDETRQVFGLHVRAGFQSNVKWCSQWEHVGFSPTLFEQKDCALERIRRSVWVSVHVSVLRASLSWRDSLEMQLRVCCSVFHRHQLRNRNCSELLWKWKVVFSFPFSRVQLFLHVIPGSRCRILELNSSTKMLRGVKNARRAHDAGSDNMQGGNKACWISSMSSEREKSGSRLTREPLQSSPIWSTKIDNKGSSALRIGHMSSITSNWHHTDQERTDALLKFYL